MMHDDVQTEIEASIDESDAHQRYCEEMKNLGDPAYQDTRPDLSATCGQATECPCAGCRKELECQDPHTQDRDSAEIDHNDEINQR